MAQGNKSRIVIWSIVGVLVVIAVVMLVTKPKNTGRPVVPDQLVKSYTRSFERLERRIATAQSKFPDTPAEQWQKMNDAIALGRDVLSRVPGLTEQKDLAAKRESLVNAYTTVTRSLRDITGKEDKGD
jgi:hypothetical protein